MTDYDVIRNKLTEHFRRQVEASSDSEVDPYNRDPVLRQQRIKMIHRVMIIIAFVFSLIALYLSWTRNTQLGESLGMKVLYGFFAAALGSTYIFFYFLRYIIDRDMIVRLDKAGVDVSLKKALENLPKGYIVY